VSSFLLLGDGSRLSLREVRESNYSFSDVDLVTLSACDTASFGGRDATGREVEGLGAMLQKQGARSVVATLWPVSDESTGVFMREFYRLREQERLTKAEALRRAQLAFIHGTTRSAGGREYAHPFHWAPFILMGNWN
jgi:CHAT domain-containing protein